MILGVGIDVVYTTAFADLLADKASCFAAATFRDAEVAYSYARSARDPLRHLAARYAAKEATLKALDVSCATSGVDRAAVALCDIEVTRDEHGRPWLLLHASADALASRSGVDKAWLSISHDGEYATAFVVLERLG